MNIHEQRDAEIKTQERKTRKAMIEAFRSMLLAYDQRGESRLPFSYEEIVFKVRKLVVLESGDTSTY